MEQTLMSDSFEVIMSGADFSGNGTRYFRGNPWPGLPVNGVSSLYAAGFLGSGWAIPDSLDWSGNERHPTIVGAPTVNAKNAVCSTANCYQLPFSGTDVRDSGAALAVAFTGSIAATTLTVSAIPSGLIWRGMKVTG